MKLSTISAGFFGIWILAACTSTGGTSQLGSMNASAIAEALPIGTPKSEVATTFGEPASISTGSDNSELWMYYFQANKTDAGAFIPIVGIYNMKTETRSLTVTFDSDERVSDYSFSKSGNVLN